MQESKGDFMANKNQNLAHTKWMCVSIFMGYLKGKSVLMIFDKYANLKYKFGNGHFWSEGY